MRVCSPGPGPCSPSLLLALYELWMRRGAAVPPRPRRPRSLLRAQGRGPDPPPREERLGGLAAASGVWWPKQAVWEEGVSVSALWPQKRSRRGKRKVGGNPPGAPAGTVWGDRQPLGSEYALPPRSDTCGAAGKGGRALGVPAGGPFILMDCVYVKAGGWVGDR